MHCFTRHRIVLASALFCVLTGLLDAPDVRAGLIVTPYDSLNWQTSEWGPEEDGFRLRVRMPSEIEYNEPVMSELELSIWLPSDTDGHLLGHRLVISNPVFSIPSPNGCSSQQYVGVIDSGETQFFVWGEVDHCTTIFVRFEVTKVRATSLASIVEQRLTNPPSSPYLVQDTCIMYNTLAKGWHDSKVSVQVEFLGTDRGPIRVGAECLPLKILPRVWTTLPMKIVCASRYLHEQDSLLVPDTLHCDTLTVRRTEGTNLGVRIAGAPGYECRYLSIPNEGDVIRLLGDTFHVPSDPQVAPLLARIFGYTLFETQGAPGHDWEQRIGEGYRELFRQNPLRWRSSQEK